MLFRRGHIPEIHNGEERYEKCHAYMGILVLFTQNLMDFHTPRGISASVKLTYRGISIRD